MVEQWPVHHFELEAGETISLGLVQVEKLAKQHDRRRTRFRIRGASVPIPADILRQIVDAGRVKVVLPDNELP